MKRAERPYPCLESKDLALVIVLGVVHEGSASLCEIITAAKELAPQHWQPTVDVVSSGIVSALNAGWLRPSSSLDRDDAQHWEITESGRGALRDLLRRSVPRHGDRVSRTCVAAKLSFLECLDPAERSLEVEELARLHREGLEALQRLCEECPARRPSSRRWLHHEIERFEWELAWLDRLRSDMESGRAA